MLYSLFKFHVYYCMFQILIIFIIISILYSILNRNKFLYLNIRHCKNNVFTWEEIKKNGNYYFFNIKFIYYWVI